MARTVVIEDGVTSVNLVNTATPGVMAEAGGFGSPTLQLGEENTAVERWTFFIKATSHNDAASQIQALIKLARRAALYRDTIWQDRDVHLKVQTTGETGTRYAVVHEIRDVQVPDVFDVPFDPGDLIEGGSPFSQALRCGTRASASSISRPRTPRSP